MPSPPLSPAEKRRKAAAWITACTALCAGSEGLRQVAYQDIGNPALWSICYGETKGVRAGDRKTSAECNDMLAMRLEVFGEEVDKCTKAELPPLRKAAMTDFAYNLGSSTYCRRVAPLLNAGQPQAACDKLLEFKYAAGIPFPGLLKRRQKERELCMVGLTAP